MERAGFRTLNLLMDTETPAGFAFIKIKISFAEMERDAIRRRIREEFEAVRARDRKGERPRVMTPENLRLAQKLTTGATRSVS